MLISITVLQKIISKSINKKSNQFKIMKKVFMSVLFMLSLVFAMAFDGKVKGISISNKVKESFTKKFEGAKSVVWVNLGDYQKASFLIDGYQVDAYYNSNGELE